MSHTFWNRTDIVFNISLWLSSSRTDSLPYEMDILCASEYPLYIVSWSNYAWLNRNIIIVIRKSRYACIHCAIPQLFKFDSEEIVITTHSSNFDDSTCEFENLCINPYRELTSFIRKNCSLNFNIVQYRSSPILWYSWIDHDFENSNHVYHVRLHHNYVSMYVVIYLIWIVFLWDLSSTLWHNFLYS